VDICVNQVTHGLNAKPDTYTTHCDTPVTFDVKVNDSNPDGTPFSITSFTQPTHAVVTLNADGTFTYTPTDHHLGADTFTYTITDAEGERATSTVTVNVTDNAPVAVADSYTTNQDTAITFDTKVNDRDPDGDPFSITGHTNASHGTVTENANGTFTYVPAAGFHGTDSFTYTISDDCGLSSTTTVSINVSETVTPPPPPPPPPVCPLTIDLGGDGITMLHDGKSQFDLTGDNATTHTAWVGPNEGILVHDVGADGNVTLDNVFGPHTNDGFTELAQLEDTNHDGVVDANDAGWNTLKVWTDTNGDGISEAGELHSLSDLGITGISVSDVHATNQDFGDAYITSSSTVTYADGHTTDMSDVFYQLNTKVDTSTVLGQQSEIVAGNSDVVTAPVQAPAADTHVAVSSGTELLNHIEQPVHPV
jgi:VCBS repeat-containing protein